MLSIIKSKSKEWFKRYLLAEVLATVLALGAAWTVYHHTGSFIAAAGAGLIAEGIGFYGYFVSYELINNAARYRQYPLPGRIGHAVKAASTNLLIEFAPAEVIDTFLVRPFTMFLLPQHVHPYPLGFLAGKFSADAIFYIVAICGYETKKRLARSH